MENNWRCLLALLVPVLLYSEKQSIKKNMGDVLSFHGIFVAAKFQLSMGSKDVTSAMLAAIFVSDVTTSQTHLYEI